MGEWVECASQADVDRVIAAGDWPVVRSGVFRAYGSATVRAYGSATVRACGSATVRACDSATVEACGSATVEAYGSATVEAYGSATVEAYDSATVEAYGSATVRACGSATVRACGSATVEAYDSATVEAMPCVAIHKHGTTPSIVGGVVIEVPDLSNGAPVEVWASYYGTAIADRTLTVFKAVDADLKSGYRTAYPVGERVECLDWSPTPRCGEGLHFSPRPFMARRYCREASRFLECRVPADLVVTLGDKLKAPWCVVVREVDENGNAIGDA